MPTVKDLLVRSAEPLLTDDPSRIRFTGFTINLFQQELTRHLKHTDAPGLFLPMLYLDERGKVCDACILALKERAVLAWVVGRLGTKQAGVTLPYTDVRSVDETEFSQRSERLPGMQINMVRGNYLLGFRKPMFEQRQMVLFKSVLNGSASLNWEVGQGSSGTPAQKPPPPRRLGANLSTEVFSDGGMEIKRVSPDSLAARAQLVPGDRLLQIDDTAIAQASDIQAALSKAAETVALVYRRGGEMLTVQASIDG